MWEVIVRKGDDEKVLGPFSYQQAVSTYEKRARIINAVKDNGEYKHPSWRLSMRGKLHKEEN